MRNTNKTKNTEFIFQDWGLTEYNVALQRQETLFRKIIDEKKANFPTENYLIFCEHPNVYTLGKSGDEKNMLLNLIQLQTADAQFVRTSRGGDITYHGPGQIVGYPIFDLENFGLGLKQYIFKIESVIIDLLAHYEIFAARLAGATGVWIDPDTPRARKICAIGVRSSHFVTMHGFALNVNTDLTFFNHINPCGFTDKAVTSMQKELKCNIDLEDVKKRLYQKFNFTTKNTKNT
ncbi:MAG: lipoyl(octanoyl) transferase LipB [Prevotellaceae bacterium]|jgi:lipoyl(octanoyl) transferase|nr:lipoyl(octanoyl) transferase LipB [Prevotellaceae bacterium]